MEYTKIIKHQNKAYIYYSKNAKILRFPTGVEVKKIDLDEKGHIREIFGKKNEIVREIRQNIEDFIREFVKKNSFKPEIEDITSHISNLQKQNKDKSAIFLEVFDLFYEDLLADVIKEKKVSNTLKSYTAFKVSIYNWQVYRKKTLFISDVNEKWFEDYKIFMRMEHNALRKEGFKFIGKTLGKLDGSTLKRRLITLKVFYKWLDKKQILEMPKIINDFSVSVDKPKKEYITINDIHSLYEKKQETLDRKRVLDMFVFACFTGLRWSDLIRINKLNIENHDGQKVIIDFNKKTKTKIIIPLHPICEEILIRHNHDFGVNDNYNQVFNVMLKKICKSSGLFSDKAKSDKVDKDGKPLLKSDKISIHTARHSFVTNLVNSSIPLTGIMIMTGHTKIETLEQYLHLPDRLDKSYICVFNKKLDL